MRHDLVRTWMWSDACEMLARAERLRRGFFKPVQSASRSPTWEPPMDILETRHEVLVVVALPGVGAESIEVPPTRRIRCLPEFGLLPAELQTAIIHRLELPQGRFERRVRRPPGQYGVIRHSLWTDACRSLSRKKERLVGEADIPGATNETC